MSEYFHHTYNQYGILVAIVIHAAKSYPSLVIPIVILLFTFASITG